jgi:glucose/arabinose dehydrogenase
MLRTIQSLGLLLFIEAVACAATGYDLANAFPGLTFTNPVCLASPPGETSRLFIVEKTGRIVVITNLAAPTRTIFMDISSKVISLVDTSVGGEEGLLGLAFHPGYATNGFFYVFYTGPATTSAGTGRHDILARYQVSGPNPNQGDASSEIRYILQYDEADNHNAGDLHFGQDGYLYVSLGDEGGGGDNYGNSQRIDKDFFSAIMRLDVDKGPGSLAPNAHASVPDLSNYAIPQDNPYVGATSFNGSPVNPSNVRTEFWAVGMRNPWRFTFDSVTGTLYLGHVGQNLIEWVDVVTKGANCGWNFYEGDKPYAGTPPEGFLLNPPLTEYGHTNGRVCIIGGVVYRGASIPPLYGAYLYADYGSGEIWALRHSGTNLTQNSILLTNAAAKWTAFGVDPSNGDVLCAAARRGTNSTIERIIYTGPASMPRITEVAISGPNLVLRGTNGPANQSYKVLATTNLITPSANWPTVGASFFDANGNFSYTNPFDATLSKRFYRLQVP